MRENLIVRREPCGGREPGDVSVDMTIDPRTRIGHVHLTVSDLDRALSFYRDVLGFEVTSRYGKDAVFLSAGGYHHHIGLNTWAGVGAPPPPPGAIGLKYFVVRLPNGPARAAVLDRARAANVAVEAVDAGQLMRDPAGNAMVLMAS